jgi:hypothetical protein
MKNRVRLLCAAVLVLMASAPARAAGGSETYTATASVRTDKAGATALVKIVIDRFATETERATVMNAIKTGHTPALKAAVAKMEDAGTIEVGDRKTAIKYAGTRPTGSGRIVTVVTAEPILFLGAGMPEAKPKAGHDVAVALLILDASGGGHGELAPAATVRTNKSGALMIDDYGAAKIWLKDVAKAK